MAVNCSTRIKKKWKISFSSAWFTFILLFSLKNLFLLHLFSPRNFFPCPAEFIFLSLYLHAFFLGLFYFVLWTWSSSPPWLLFFYHTFIWLTSRLRQAERGRQSAELDNRLFKQDFGDKINSLQLEVEALTRQRWRKRSFAGQGGRGKYWC